MHKMYLTSNIKNNIYKNNQWIQDGNIIKKYIKGYNLKPITFTLPNSKSDLYSFLSKKIIINEIEKDKYITNTYPSKYLSDFRKNIKTWSNNLIKIDDKYVKYLNELGITKLSIEALNAYPNDIDGILSFDYQIKDQNNNINNFSYLGSKQINNFKKIDNLFKNNTIIFLNSIDQNIKNRFIKNINKIKTKDELNNLSNNKETIEISNLGVNGYGALAKEENNTKAIIVNEISKGETTNEKWFEIQSNKFEFVNSIFIDKQLMINNIDFSTNLFNNEFIINNLFFTTNMSENAKLIGINANSFKYESNIEITISLCKSSINNENNQTFKINGKLSLTLLLNDFK